MYYNEGAWITSARNATITQKYAPRLNIEIIMKIYRNTSGHLEDAAEWVLGQKFLSMALGRENR